MHVARTRHAGRRAGVLASVAGAAAVLAAVLAAALPAGLATGPAAAAPPPRPAATAAVRPASPVPIHAVGAENEYANVIAQIGGRFVDVTAILSNPNADPHTFEVSPQVAQQLSSARLVVQNGLGYDDFMNKLEQATPSRSRRVIDVQQLLRLPATTPNPHLWYAPGTMPAVAKAVAADLSAMDPAHRAAFSANLRRFDASLGAWRQAVARLRRRFAGRPVATTEPVADYLLQAAGLADKTPFAFQADVMNGIDPSPQAVSLEQQLLDGHHAQAFVYNEQVTDSLTSAFLATARQHHVPVVGVYETMPTRGGFDYQRWMLDETNALYAALAEHRSTA